MHPYTPGMPAWYNFSFGIFVFGVLPILIAGIFGYCIGARILSSSRISSGKQAVICGLKVALFSFFVFAPLFSLTAAIDLSLLEPTPNSTFAVEVVKLFFGALLMVIIMGAIVLGWLVALTAATAGWLLFKMRPLLLRLG